MYDLSECHVRIPNTSIKRFNVDLFRADYAGFGRCTYLTYADNRFVSNPDDPIYKLYQVADLRATAITNADTFSISWNTEDITSHRAMRYETSSNYFNEKFLAEVLVNGGSDPDYYTNNKDTAFFAYTAIVEYTNGRVYEIPVDQFTGNYLDGTLTFDFDRLEFRDINNVPVSLRPTNIKKFSIKVYPKSYGCGIGSSNAGHELYDDGQLKTFTIKDYSLSPSIGDELEIYNQRGVISDVQASTTVVGALDLTIEKIDGFSIVVQPNAGRLTQKFRVHPNTPKPLVDNEKITITLSTTEDNLSTGHENATLNAWKPLASILSPSYTPIGTTICYDEFYGVSPRLISQQLNKLNIISKPNVDMGGSEWPYFTAKQQGVDVVKEIDVGAPITRVAEEFYYWSHSLAVHFEEETGTAGLSVLISTKASEATKKNTVQKEYLQADADGNKTAYYSPSALYAVGLLRNAITDVIEYLVDHPTQPISGVEVKVGVMEWHFNDFNGWVNIYDLNTQGFYFAETGNSVPTPFLKDVEDITAQEITDNTDFFAWINNKLGEMALEIRSQLITFYPAIPIHISANVPNITDVDIPALEYLNNFTQYDSANWSFMQIASYRHVLENDFVKVHDNFTFLADKNFTDATSLYSSGKIPDYISRWKWVYADRALNMAEGEGIDKKFVDSTFAMFRDGFFWFGYNDQSVIGFTCGGCNG